MLRFHVRDTSSTFDQALRTRVDDHLSSTLHPVGDDLRQADVEVDVDPSTREECCKITLEFHDETTVECEAYSSNLTKAVDRALTGIDEAIRYHLPDNPDRTDSRVERLSPSGR